MSVNFPSQPSGQQVSGQDLVALNNKPSVKGLASIVSRSISQQVGNNPVNNTANKRVLPQMPQAFVSPDVNTLPPPMSFQPIIDNHDLPPSDMPPELPLDLPVLPLPIIVEEKTNAKGIDIILPSPMKAFPSLPMPIFMQSPPIVISSPVVKNQVPEVKGPSIVISSPRPSQIVNKELEVKTSPKVISSPRPLPIVKKAPEVKAPVMDINANERMRRLRERADLNSLDYVSKDLNSEIEAEAKKQGYVFDASMKLYVKGEEAKTWADFEAEISGVKTIPVSSEDEAFAKDFESKLKLESKISRQEEEEKNLALTMKLIEEEEKQAAFRKLLEETKVAEDLALAQDLVNTDQQKVASIPLPKCDLSDDCINMLTQNGWTLDFDGMFGIDASGDMLLFDDIKNIYDR